MPRKVLVGGQHLVNEMLTPLLARGSISSWGVHLSDLIKWGETISPPQYGAHLFLDDRRPLGRATSKSDRSETWQSDRQSFPTSLVSYNAKNGRMRRCHQVTNCALLPQDCLVKLFDQFWLRVTEYVDNIWDTRWVSVRYKLSAQRDFLGSTFLIGFDQFWPRNDDKWPAVDCRQL